MNKIYKVMYSKVKQCAVVVSEIAKSHGRHTKSSVAKSSAALTAGVLIALGSFSFVGMPVAQAADGTESMKNNDYVGANGYYWYFDEKTNQWTKYPYKLSSLNNNRSWQELPNYEGGGAKEPGAVTAGLYAQAGEQTVTIGNRNAGQSKGSVFIGELNGYNDGGKNDPVGMRNNYVTAVGFQSNATGWGSIAIGSNAVAENTQETSQVVDYEGSAGTSGTVQDDNYGIKLKPSIKWSSVALGYSAQAKDGNIAIGAYSEATDTSSATPYVSVGSSKLQRRITNVADGTGDTDVATVGQMNKAIESIGTTGWNLSTNGNSSSTTTITSGKTVDFSPAVDGKNGTTDHKNVNISNDGSKVKISLNKNIVLGEATNGNGGSLNVYSDSTEASNLGNRVSIDGSTVSVNYGKEDGTSGTKRGVVLGVGEDYNNNAQGYIAFNNIDAKGTIGSTYLHSATDAPNDLKGRLVYSNAIDGTEYIANLDDGITFTGDVQKDVPKDYTQTPTKLDTTLNITGGAKTVDDLTSGNIGVVSTPAAENADGTKTQASKLEIKLNKDLKGITSITSQTTDGTTTSGATITLGTNGTTISGGDVNVSSHKITGLKDGAADTDAATVGQMKTAIGDAKTKYYSVQEGLQIGGFSTNENNDGATDAALAGMAAGYETGTAGIASTVVGSYSGVMNTGTALGPWGLDYRGATAVSLGTVNVNNNTDTSKLYSGVANSIVGQANMTTDSNAAIIVGAGNSVTNSYRELDKDALSAIKSAGSVSALKDALQAAVPKSGAQVMVMGGGNNVEGAYMSQVVGVGNTVTGADSTYAEGTSTQYNFVDGFQNELTNGKHDYIIGSNNSVSGDSINENQSNIVVGDNHTLNNKKNNVVLGSADSSKELAASGAVVIGHNADVSVDNGVALGSDSVASVQEGQKGYDPAKEVENKTKEPWTSTKAAVSVGKADGSVTRQITGVAAGTNDTDAVNVAQIKKLASVDASNIGKNFKDGDVPTNENAWGEALGTGTVTKDNKQLVTGGTVYNEVRPSKDGKYVRMSQTTGDNLLKLDDQVKTNTDKLSDVDSRSVKYDTKTENGKTVVDNAKITLAGDGGTTITNLKDGVNNSDAATVGQLNSKIAGVTYTAGNGIAMDSTAKTISAKAGNGITVDTNGINAKAGTGITVDADGINVNTGKHLSVNTNGQVDVGDNGKVAANDGNLVTGKTVYDALNGGLTKIIVGTPGKDGKDGTPGTPGTIGLVGPAGADGKNAEVDITIQQGKDNDTKGIKGANGVDGTDGINRIVYEDKNGKHQVATMEDGLKFKGDDTTVINKKLNSTLDIIGGAKGDLTEGNIGVKSTTDGKLKVQLAQELTGITSISGSTGSNGAKITLDTNDQNISVNGGKITDVASGLSTNDGSYNAKDANNAANISDVNSMISKAVTDAKGETQQDLDKKANVDASNIGTNLKGADGKTAATEDEQKANLDKWGEAIGTGEVKDGSKQLVTGNTVYNAVKDKADKSYVDTQLNTKANTDGSNIDADKFSKKVAIGNINDSDERAVSGKTVNEAIQTINGNIDGKANKNLDNIDDAGKNVIKDQARAAVTIDNKGLNTNVVATQDDKNHTTTYTINVEGNGKVAAKDTGLISGDTIYKELRPATDGNYIKTTNTTAQNLTSLDTQVRATHDLINSDGKTIKIGGSDAATKIDVNGNDGKGRVITGVVSDANDPNSAANVGYVNGLTAANTQQIYRDMNNAYGRLNNNINKAAAGSNALAALHPLDYDPDDKADFAVGYGHYRNANAAAVGAFYHPNENTMVNVGVSLGNGDPGFNAGVSFKVGRGGAGREAMSKTEMAKVINSQSKEIDALKKDNADKDKRIDALEQKMAEILAKLDKNGK